MRNARFAGTLQSPLTDSNRRPPPYICARNYRQSRATDSACLSHFRGARICRRSPQVASALLHKCSIPSPEPLLGKGIQTLSLLPASPDHLCSITVPSQSCEKGRFEAEPRRWRRLITAMKLCPFRGRVRLALSERKGTAYVMRRLRSQLGAVAMVETCRGAFAASAHE